MKLVALSNMFDIEEHLVLGAHVSEPEADTGAVPGGGPYHILEYLRDIQWGLPTLALSFGSVLLLVCVHCIIRLSTLCCWLSLRLLCVPKFCLVIRLQLRAVSE